MRLGLDFGTTNSAIALFDGQDLIPVEIELAGDDSTILPSLIYIDKEHQALTGLAAATAYIEHETGRPVHWRQREVGQLSITVASFEGEPIQFYDHINVMVDIAAHGKLLQSIKTVLFNSKYEGTQIFDRFYRIEELIGIILQRLKAAAEKQLERAIDSIVLGRPVRFSHRPIVNSRAEAILFKAAHLAGFSDVIFQLEPVGVVHLIHRTSQQRRTALVFDFGGGTLDLTIAKIGGESPPEILATHGVLVGGDDFNRRIMSFLLPHFGDEDPEHPLPPDIADKLLAWQTLPDLSRPKMIERLRDLRRTRQNPPSLAALETLVRNNLGFKLFEEIDRVKKCLSDETQAAIHLQYENIDLHQILTRRRFERLIAPDVALVQEGIEDILSSASLDPSQIDRVVRTGGSSQIPVFIRLLEDMFAEEKLTAIDPLVSVVGGFATTAYEYQKPAAIDPADLIELMPVQNGKQIDVITARLYERCYTGHDFRIDRLPPLLNGLPLIRSSHHDENSTADEAVRFTLKQAATILVAYEDARVDSIPQWLKSFKSEPLLVLIKHQFGANMHYLHIYSRDFAPGEIVLGGNRAAGYQGNLNMNYVVFVRPLSIDPPPGTE